MFTNISLVDCSHLVSAEDVRCAISALKHKQTRTSTALTHQQQQHFVSWFLLFFSVPARLVVVVQLKPRLGFVM